MAQDWTGERIPDPEPDLEITEDAAGIVHDLRIPLSVLEGYAHLLGSGDLGELSPTVQAAAETIAAKAAEMRILLDALLELTRTESAGRVASQVHSSNLADSARGACERAAGRARMEGDEVQLEVAHESVPVRADSRLLDRILDNLLHNALTHAPHPARVVVRVGRDAGRGEVRVEDNGPGIDPGILRGLFAGRVSGRSATAGAGLGLRLCHALAARLGGTLELVEESSAGTVFRLSLPLSS